jgi:hypothetical protein
MGIMENIPFFFGVFFPLVEFEIRHDRLVQYRMTKVFLPIKNCSGSGRATQIWGMEFGVVVVLQVAFFRIGDRIKTLSAVRISVLFPSSASWKIRFTTSAASGSTTSVCLSPGSLI